MFSAVLLALTSLQQDSYASVAVLTAVIYDYVITFLDEVEYIWNKPWTWVSTLFVLVRYCGLYSLVIPIIVGSGFLFAPAKLCANTSKYFCDCSIYEGFQGKIIIITESWTFVLFLGATDFVMILHVWAMYSRSRQILNVLLTFFCPEIASIALSAAIDSFSGNTAVNVEILDASFCVVQGDSLSIWTQVASAFQITHGLVMCTLAIFQFVRQSLQMYAVTKQWQLNRYMNLLVKDGVLYFFAILLFNLSNISAISGIVLSEGWQLILLLVAEFVPIYTLTPQFIISMRELYARDIRGRCGTGIDTGFGLSLSGRGTTMTTIMFADIGENERSDDVEEMPLEVLEVGTTQSS